MVAAFSKKDSLFECATLRIFHNIATWLLPVGMSFRGKRVSKSHSTDALSPPQKVQGFA